MPQIFIQLITNQGPFRINEKGRVFTTLPVKLNFPIFIWMVLSLLQFKLVAKRELEYAVLAALSVHEFCQSPIVASVNDKILVFV